MAAEDPADICRTIAGSTDAAVDGRVEAQIVVAVAEAVSYFSGLSRLP